MPQCVVLNDLGRKNRTTRYNCSYSAASLALRVIFSVSYLWNIFGSFTEPFSWQSATQNGVHSLLIFASDLDFL